MKKAILVVAVLLGIGSLNFIQRSEFEEVVSYSDIKKALDAEIVVLRSGHYDDHRGSLYLFTTYSKKGANLTQIPAVLEWTRDRGLQVIDSKVNLTWGMQIASNSLESEKCKKGWPILFGVKRMRLGARELSGICFDPIKRQVAQEIVFKGEGYHLIGTTAPLGESGTLVLASRRYQEKNWIEAVKIDWRLGTSQTLQRWAMSEKFAPLRDGFFLKSGELVAKSLSDRIVSCTYTDKGFGNCKERAKPIGGHTMAKSLDGDGFVISTRGKKINDQYQNSRVFHSNFGEPKQGEFTFEKADVLSVSDLVAGKEDYFVLNYIPNATKGNAVYRTNLGF